MRDSDLRYLCPQKDCGYTNFDGGECPECGSALEKVKGEEFVRNDEDESFGANSYQENVDEFDPNDISWYQEESLETM